MAMEVDKDESQSELIRHASSYSPMHIFDLPDGASKHYQQQYGQLYFVRLAQLKPVLTQIADEAWGDFVLGSTKVQHVHRVLDVRQGQLCWVVGTVYMDMPLKPNVLEDIGADRWIEGPPVREKYLNDEGEVQHMLEDESGRLRMVGGPLDSVVLVTGCIIAAMGTENRNGEFEVIDIRLPDLGRQPQRWERQDAETTVVSGSSKRKKGTTAEDRQPGGKVAIVSGLGITGDNVDGIKLEMLAEYLLGELLTHEDAQDLCRISRLIIAGGSLIPKIEQERRDLVKGKKYKKTYGYDASSYNAAPTVHLDRFLASILPSMPVTIMPGEDDPANISLPQQPLHPALLPQARGFGTPLDKKEQGWFDSVTNPWQGDVDGWRFLGTSGQPIDDVFKYVQGHSRIEMMECLMRWRNGAPTAPDTLACYPFQGKDPFIINDTPHLYFVGNQPDYDTTLIEGPAGQTVRLVAVPRFWQTGGFVIVDTDTLETEHVRIELCEET